MKTLCLDFDGVIHSYTSGWKGVAVIPDPPVPGAIDAILTYMDAGFEVAIYSSRSNSLRGRWAMQRWLGNEILEHWRAGANSSVYFDCESESDVRAIAWERIRWPWFKPAAFLTLDDRALCFNGTWPSVETINRFKPWFKL